MTQSLGWKQHHLTLLRLELSQGCGVSGDVAQPPPEHPDLGTTQTGRDAPREATLPGHHGSIPGMLIPHFFPLPAPLARCFGAGTGWGFRGRGVVDTSSSFLRMCLLQHLPAAAAAPPARSLRLGRGVSCRANATSPGQHPGQRPAAAAAPREPLRASWGWSGQKELGTRVVQNIKSGPRPPHPPRVLRRFPVLRYLGAPFPVPGHAHTVPGGWQPWHQVRRHFCFRGDASLDAQQLRGAAGGAEPGGSQQGRRLLFGVLPTPCHPPRW